MCKTRWLDQTALRLPYLALCTSEKQYLKIMKYLKVENVSAWLSDSAGASNHTFIKNGKLTCVVCVRIDKGRDIASTASYLAHESVHVAQEMFEAIGEEKPSCEVYAYAVENATRNLMDEYLRQEKRHKRAAKN